MAGLSTHVLDTSTGLPASGIEVVHHFIDSTGAAVEVACGVTDGDGRIRELGALTAGHHRLVFATGVRTSFYPSVTVDFVVDDESRHHHIPLLLSPFGYSTYRGS